MSRLQETLSKLRKLEAKINFLKKIQEDLKEKAEAAKKDANYDEAKAIGEVISYITGRISQIENGDAELILPETRVVRNQSEPQVSKGTFIDEEEEETPNPKRKPAKPVDDDPELPNDPLKFAMKFRHLDGKTVMVVTDNGNVDAKVRGVDPAQKGIIVTTSTGYTLTVSPKKIQEVK